MFSFVLVGAGACFTYFVIVDVIVDSSRSSGVADSSDAASFVRSSMFGPSSAGSSSDVCVQLEFCFPLVRFDFLPSSFCLELVATINSLVTLSLSCLCCVLNSAFLVQYFFLLSEQQKQRNSN